MYNDVHIAVAPLMPFGIPVGYPSIQILKSKENRSCEHIPRIPSKTYFYDTHITNSILPKPGTGHAHWVVTLISNTVAFSPFSNFLVGITYAPVCFPRIGPRRQLCQPFTAFRNFAWARFIFHSTHILW